MSLLDGEYLGYEYKWRHFDCSIRNIRKVLFIFMRKIRYHLVDQSPWPFVVSGGVFNLVTLTVFYLHNGYTLGLSSFGKSQWLFNNGYLVTFVFGLLGVGFWLRDIIREGTFEGQHTYLVRRGLRLGFALFILSEVVFFGGFFWGYFWLCQSSEDSLSGFWPGKGLAKVDPLELPLCNTILLLSSGVSLTYSHEGLLLGNRRGFINGLFITILLAFIFILVQSYEYKVASLTISDGSYGSCFYLLTGFHGFHVLIGLLMLVVTFVRGYNYHLTSGHHLGFEVSGWYWHFVDVVWLYLYIALYIYGSLILI